MKGSIALLILLLVSAGCGGTAHTSDTPAGPTPTRAAAALLTPTPGVQPIVFPDDEAPHDTLTEWWYYTGHLYTVDGARYGFEFVIFQGRRAFAPTGYSAHFAITDSSGGTFAYDQRFAMTEQSPAAEGFALSLGDWSMSGANGVDTLRAAMDGYAIDIELTATKPPALHGGDGYLSLGDLGGSYYYSRTRMEISGMLTIDGRPHAVYGEAWMDHQWGNFIPVGEGGWDWFSVQFYGGPELMIYQIRDAQGMVNSYGSIVETDGSVIELEAEEFVVTALESWTSPHSGATYPMGWTIDVPALGYSLTLTPTLEDQELDTRASTGVIYWEGEVTVFANLEGSPIAGLGYVELTGYDNP